jgi:hypothetical protein
MLVEHILSMRSLVARTLLALMFKEDWLLVVMQLLLAASLSLISCMALINVNQRHWSLAVNWSIG